MMVIVISDGQPFPGKAAEAKKRAAARKSSFEKRIQLQRKVRCRKDGLSFFLTEMLPFCDWSWQSVDVLSMNASSLFCRSVNVHSGSELSNPPKQVQQLNSNISVMTDKPNTDAHVKQLAATSTKTIRDMMNSFIDSLYRHVVVALILKAFRDNGVTVAFLAIHEADSQRLYMIITKQVDFLLVEDSDCIAYGAKRCLFGGINPYYMKKTRENKITVAETYDFTDFAPIAFQVMASLIGCDYTRGQASTSTKGCGKKQAYTVTKSLKPTCTRPMSRCRPRYSQPCSHFGSTRFGGKRRTEKCDSSLEPPWLVQKRSRKIL
jgi:hypothetical protein